MKSTEKPQSQYDHISIQQQFKHAIDGSKAALDNEGVQADGVNPEARSAFIGFMNDPLSISNLFNAPGGLAYRSAGMLAQYTQCPVEVPFCSREKCLNSYGQEPQTAFECYSVPGCCFDPNLYMYRLSFGQGFMSSTAVCHRAVKTPMFNFFSTQLATLNSGMFMPSLMEAVSNKIIDFANTQSGHKMMMEFHQCPQGDGMGASTMRFHFQMAKLWPMYSVLRAKGSQITDDLIDALSPYCGWSGITRAQCMLKGCCWNLNKEKCTAPLDLTGHNQQSVQSAALALLLKTGDEKAKAEAGASRSVSLGGYYRDSIYNGIAYKPGPVTQSLMNAGAGQTVDSSTGNLFTMGSSLPVDTFTGRKRRSTSGSLDSLYQGSKKDKSSKRSSSPFQSRMSSMCESKIAKMLIPACKKMEEFKIKMKQMQTMSSMIKNRGQGSTFIPNNGAKQSILSNMFGGSPFSENFGSNVMESLNSQGLMLGKVADSIANEDSPVKKFLMMQMLSGNSGSASYATDSKYSRPGPVTAPNVQPQQYNPKPMPSSGTTYQSNTISGMYDTLTESGNTDVQNCPAHQKNDHS